MAQPYPPLYPEGTPIQDIFTPRRHFALLEMGEETRFVKAISEWSYDDFIANWNAFQQLADDGYIPHIIDLQKFPDGSANYAYMVQERLPGLRLMDIDFQMVPASLVCLEYVRLCQALAARGITFEDLHGANILFNTDTLQMKAVDIGTIRFPQRFATRARQERHLRAIEQLYVNDVCHDMLLAVCGISTMDDFIYGNGYVLLEDKLHPLIGEERLQQYLTSQRTHADMKDLQAAIFGALIRERANQGGYRVIPLDLAIILIQGFAHPETVTLEDIARACLV